MRKLLWGAPLLLVGCLVVITDKDEPDPDTDVVDTDVVDTDVVDTDVVDTDVVDSDTDVAETDTDTDVAETDTDGDSDSDTEPPFVPTTCAEALGVCTSASACAAGGTVLPAFAGDCIFSDGPGVCCQTPPLQTSGTTCSDYGGVCAPIAGCDFVTGWFTPSNECFGSYGPSYVCCAPEDQCGPATSECCGGTAVYRTTCDRGVESCSHLPGTTQVPLGTCIVP